MFWGDYFENGLGPASRRIEKNEIHSPRRRSQSGETDSAPKSCGGDANYSDCSFRGAEKERRAIQGRRYAGRQGRDKTAPPPRTFLALSRASEQRRRRRWRRRRKSQRTLNPQILGGKRQAEDRRCAGTRGPDKTRRRGQLERFRPTPKGFGGATCFGRRSAESLADGRGLESFAQRHRSRLSAWAEAAHPSPSRSPYTRGRA